MRLTGDRLRICSDVVAASTCRGEGGSERRNPKAKLSRNHAKHTFIPSPPQGKPGHAGHCGGMVCQLAWEHLGIPLDESLEEMTGVNELEAPLATLGF